MLSILLRPNLQSFKPVGNDLAESCSLWTHRGYINGYGAAPNGVG
jgi:hypothetical protein